MLLSIKLITTLFLLAAAPPNPDLTLAPFYHGLHQPSTGMGCCDIADCREVNYRMVGTHFEVFIDSKLFPNGPDKWLPVPKQALLPPQPNPTGEGVACWTPSMGVLCFLEANGT